jgi:DNA polymerase V
MLINQRQGSRSARVKIPLLFSSIPAGFPSPAEDYIEAMIDLNELLITNPVATYLMRVQGLSMIEGGIFPQDIIVVDRSIDAQNGDVVVAVVDGEYNVKRLYHQEGQIMLLSDNPDYPPIVVPELAELTIWGVVTNVIHQVKRCLP